VLLIALVFSLYEICVLNHMNATHAFIAATPYLLYSLGYYLVLVISPLLPHYIILTNIRGKERKGRKDKQRNVTS